WDPKAKEARTQVANYIRREFGARRKTRFLQEVRQVTQQLKRSPGIGRIDPLFSDRTRTYRSVIINGLNKLVYFTEGDILYIAGFWDTRMQPEDQAAQVK
ncbi:MAG: type II toxin-antitoxin system RelE/ParE family toxin, partial [Bacteroidaceae bacterium]|nr:type II toxin-antitoxin system RelE/ParE family toxin [Bacteroidaceae bacterium]